MAVCFCIGGTGGGCFALIVYRLQGCVYTAVLRLVMYDTGRGRGRRDVGAVANLNWWKGRAPTMLQRYLVPLDSIVPSIA